MSFPGIATATTMIQWTLCIFIDVLVLATLLPLIRHGTWMIRLWDFPRVQLAGLAVSACAGAVVLGFVLGWSTAIIVHLILAAAVVLWQGVYIARYTHLWPIRVKGSETIDLRLLIANLDFRNSQHAQVRTMLTQLEPDLLLLVEINQAWAEALDDLRSQYPHCVEAILPDGLGMALWSRFELITSDIDYLVSEKRPSIHALVQVRRDNHIRFVGVHPTPPALAREENESRYSSRIRDAELVRVARQVGEDPLATWIVAGDFNDVAWSDTTRLFEKLSGLADPRVGRGMFNTYHARYPLLRYPLDHVMISPNLRIGHIDRVRIPGSDHFAMLADLDCRAESMHAPEAGDADREKAAELVAEGFEEAASKEEAIAEHS